MAAYTSAKHVCYVTIDPAHDLVREHIRAGGRAIALEAGVNGQMNTIYDRGAHIPLLWTHLIPATLEGRATFNVQNAMFAAAMAFSMGVRLEDIRHGLRTFDTTFFQAPGRLNVYDEHPFKVLFDYGHNAHAVSALAQLVNRMTPAGRRICVLSAPGDRRDEDILAIAQVAAEAQFDYYICRRDDALRGRGEDDVPRMLVEGLIAHGIGSDRITMIVDEQQAIESALRMARAGDLLLIFADALARGWKQITNFRPDESALVVPAPRAARAVPRQSVTEQAPADDVTPAKAAIGAATVPVASPPSIAPARWNIATDEIVLMRDERGVILAPEASD
jgi:cyanophycin synthetase